MKYALGCSLFGDGLLLPDRNQFGFVHLFVFVGVRELFPNGLLLFGFGYPLVEELLRFVCTAVGLLFS